MTDHRFTDTATLSGTRRTSDGFLVTDARAVRTGIQLYTGAEMGIVGRDVVRVYRPEDEVRSPASLTSFSHAPVTMGHPTENVTADNWKDLAIGEVSTAAKWEDDHISLPLILKDAAAIAAVESGTRELSAGYTCQVEMADGVTPDGQPYDAIQRNIRINHLAVVPRGRAGSTRIGDGADTWGLAPITDAGKEVSMTLRKIMVDGLEVETTDAGAAAIQKLTNDVAAKDKAMTDAETAHTAAIAAKDGELAKKDAEIDKLTKSQLSDADIDKRVAARAEIIGKALSVAKDVKTAGLSDADIRKAVVTAKLGDAAVKDKSDAYIEARFDVLTEDAAKAADPVAGAIKGGVRTQDAAGDETQAYEAYLADFNPQREEAN